MSSSLVDGKHLISQLAKTATMRVRITHCHALLSCVWDERESPAGTRNQRLISSPTPAREQRPQMRPLSLFAANWSAVSVCVEENSCNRSWRRCCTVLFANNALLKVAILRRRRCSLTKTPRSALFTAMSQLLVNKTGKMSLLTNAPLSRRLYRRVSLQIITSWEYL